MPRNLSGVYTLPAGNPVVPGTTIDANWANSTLSDMANEITNSLSRTGAGGMLAPFRIDDGNVTGPGLAFLNETNTGFYRLAAGSTAFSVLGVNTLQMNTTSVTVPSNRTLNAQGNSLVGGTFGVTGAAAFASTLVATGAITALGGVLGNITAASGTSSFNDVTISGSLDMVAGSSATITGLSNPTNASDAANKGYVDTQDALKLNLTGGTMSGNLAMGNNLITGLGTAVSGGDATNKTYVDGQIATRLALAGGTMSGAIAMGTNKITGLGTPTADADAATKAYVDSVAQGLDVKGSVRAATTGNITLSGTQTIDGVAIGAGDRVLVKDQSTAANNGIYVAAAGAWSRAADADTWNELVGAFVFVEDGTTNDNSGWVCTSPPGGTLGVTAVTFEQFSGAGQINAGTGMTKTGNTLNVNTASSSRIVVGADEIDLAQTGVTAGTYKSVTVDLYGRVTAGTNPTTLAGYGIIDAYTQTQTDTLLNGKLSLTGGTMSGALAMGTSKITGLGNPTNAQDAATKTYVDTADALKLNLTGGTMSGALAMGTNRITGVGDPVNAQDAATKNYIDTIFGSTTSAAASAAAAASSATAASTSASNAASSASAASTSASNAATSLFNFRAQYLGPLASDPTVDGNGNAVTAGDLYWNTTVNETRIYNGTSWVAAYLPAAGYMDLTTNQTAAGVKTFSSNPILSGGTANGVAYLNGSKVLTTGSALTFDGSYFTAASGTGAFFADVTQVSGNATKVNANGVGLEFRGGATPNITAYSRVGSAYLPITIDASNSIFSISGSEAMRLTSTGLGIGTSSPAFKLHVGGAGSQFALISTTDTTSTTGLLFGDSASNTVGRVEYVHSDNGMRFFTNGTSQATLDSSGNLGLGVTPSAWASGYKALQIGATGALWQSASGFTFLSDNAYVDSGAANRYITTNFATLYRQQSGQHNWFTAPSGTAGNAISFTQAMTLSGTSDAVLLLGTTSPAYGTAGRGLFEVNGSSTALIAVKTGDTARGYFAASSSITELAAVGASQPLVFTTNATERARITSGGDLGIGTTSPSQRLDVRGSVYVQRDSNPTNALAVQLTNQTTVSNNGCRLSFDAYNIGSSALGVPSDSASLAFYTGGVTTERARITSGGDFLFGTTSAATTADVGVKTLASTTMPYILNVVNTASGTNGVYSLYNTNATFNGTRFYAQINGGVANYSANNTNLSDERVKTNISLADGYLTKICAIPVKTFNYKDEPEGEQKSLGVIAQDVEAVAPELVCNDGFGETPEDGVPLKSIYQTDLQYALMKCIQEQQAIITDLRQRVAALEAK